MRRIVLVTSLVSVFLLSFAGMASASYNPVNDQTINITAPVKLPALNTAAATFNIQQSLQQNVSSATGTSINYYYIWINVNGQPVAAVDPAKFMF
jgi:hypothetical protein